MALAKWLPGAPAPGPRTRPSRPRLLHLVLIPVGLLGVTASLLSACGSNTTGAAGQASGTPLDHLTGHEWTLDRGASSVAFNRGPTIALPPFTGRVTITFRSGDVLSGISPCDSYRSTFTLDGRHLTIGDVQQSRTLARCPASNLVAEHEYIAALKSVDYVQATSSNRLELTGSEAKLSYNAS